MKESWRIRKLGEILDIQNGFAFDSKLFGNDGMQLIRIRDLKNGYITETNYKGNYDKGYLVNAGDFLIGMDGEFKCYEWKGEPSLLNQRVCRLENFSEEIYDRFLFYGINKYLKDIEDVTAFTTVKHISSRQIKDIDFPLPPISEQKRIVKILDEKFEAIEKLKKVTEEQLVSVKELFESRLNESFSPDDSWESSFLGDVCEIGDGNHSSKYPKASEMVSEGIPFLRAGNVSGGFVLEGDMKYITLKKHKELKKGHLREGDVLFTNRGEIGKMAVIPGEFHNSNLNSQVAWFRCSSEIVNWYLYYFLSTRSSKNLIKTLETGTALKQLPIGNLKKIEIFYPPTSKQIEIVQELNKLSENIKKLEKVYIEKNTNLEELKKSYLEQAFAGKL